MEDQHDKANILKLALGAMVAFAIDLLAAWLGRTLHTICSITIGVVVGLAAWCFSDFPTGFYSGFLAWIVGWILLLFVPIAFEFALQRLVNLRSRKSDSAT